MSQAEFVANADVYIRSVATTAGVLSKNVQIISINEIATRSSSNVAVRLLLATSVNVQTSILLAAGQQTRIYDLSALNGNLKENGLPTGTLVLVSQNSATAEPATLAGTPAPVSAGAATSGSTSSTGVNIPVLAGTIVGAVVGLIVLLLCARSFIVNQGAKSKGSGAKYATSATSTVILEAQVTSLQDGAMWSTNIGGGQ